jgi:hypothetical protein
MYPQKLFTRKQELMTELTRADRMLESAQGYIAQNRELWPREVRAAAFDTLAHARFVILWDCEEDPFEPPFDTPRVLPAKIQGYKIRTKGSR